MKDTYAENPPKGIPKTWGGGGKLICCWPYRDADGAKIFGWDARYDFPDGKKQVIPFFNQDDNGNWKTGLADGLCPLFGLDTIKGHTRVYVAEGCKPASAVHRMGLPCVSSQGGSNAPAKSDWTPLESVGEVIIAPDNDEPGDKYACDVAERLTSQFGDALTVSIAKLGGLPESGDVVDWLQLRYPDWDGYGELPLTDSDERMGLRQKFCELVDECREEYESLQPLQLCAPTIPRTPYPVESLGPILGPVVNELIETVQAPPEICAQSVLAAMSLATQGRANVRHDGLESPLSLFFLTVAKSGDRKSTADDNALRPVLEIQKNWMGLYREAMKDYKRRHDIWTSEKRKILNPRRNQT